MNSLWLVCLIPLIIPWIVKLIFKTTITFPEMAVQIIICTLSVVIVWQTGKFSRTRDVEIINGVITGKKSVRVSCSHSYSCNCYTSCSGSGKNRTCHEVCQTCYEHDFDVEWRVYTNLFNNKSFTIDTIDRQGIKEPHRWSEVKKGQPASSLHNYVNYIKAVPNSIFNLTVDMDKYGPKIPKYPSVYDYHKSDRVLNLGVKLDNIKKWNDDLSKILSTLGPKKQANIIIITIKSGDSSYRHAVENAWLRGKKNDIVVFLGSEDGTNISWTDVMSWAKHDIFNIKLRDALLDIKTFDRQRIMSTIESITSKDFVRRPMEEFEYLKDEIKPEPWVQMLAGIIGIVFSIIGTIIMHKYDIFDKNNFRRY